MGTPFRLTRTNDLRFARIFPDEPIKKGCLALSVGDAPLTKIVRS